MNTKLFTLFFSLAFFTFTFSSKAQLNIPTAGTPVSVTFSNFLGTGFSPAPTAGQLNSTAISIKGNNAATSCPFGTIRDTGVFARGASPGPVNTGGIYAFNTGGNSILGIQPINNFFGQSPDSGSIIVKIKNNTGVPITALHITYDVYCWNDQSRSTYFRFSSDVDTVGTYTQVPSATFVSDSTGMGIPSWLSYPRTVDITGLNIAANGLYYLRWTGGDVTGVGSGARDQIGLDNVSIIANPTPVNAAFSATTVCEGASTQFTDQSFTTVGSISNWYWDFGDATTVVTAPSPSHQYAAPGTYNVILFVTESGGTPYDSVTIPVTVRPKPTVHFLASPLTGCAPLDVQFTDSSYISSGSINSVLWNFGGSLTDTTSVQNPNHTYTTAGSYTVKLRAFSTGCNSLDSVINFITVNTSPSAGFSTSSGTNIGDVVFSSSTSTGASSYSWDFGDMSAVSTTPSPTHTYTVDGTYTVCLTVTGGGCSDSVCHPVIIAGMGIEKIDPNMVMSVSPNPSKGLITVDVTNLNLHNSTIKIYSIIGKEVEHLDMTQLAQDIYQIDLSSQVDGFYFVRVQTPKEIFTWRVALSK